MADDGEPCCEAAVPPTCYIARNDEDKGGKDDQWMVISLEAHKLMNDFLLITVREDSGFYLLGGNIDSEQTRLAHPGKLIKEN